MLDLGLGRESTRVVPCNTTSTVRTLSALKRAGLLKRARGTLLRRATDPWESHLGGIMNTLVPEPEIHHAEANYLNETVTVGYDDGRIAQAEVERLIERCGYHCRCEVVPAHLCAPAPGVAAEHRPPTRWGTGAG